MRRFAALATQRRSRLSRRRSPPSGRPTPLFALIGPTHTEFYLGPTDGPAWAKDTVQSAHAAGIKALLMLGGAGAGSFLGKQTLLLVLQVLEHLQLCLHGTRLDSASQRGEVCSAT